MPYLRCPAEMQFRFRCYRTPELNAEPWEPLPGMVKRRCPWCRYLFAAPVDSEELRCPDCVTAGSRSRPAAEPLGTD